MRWIAHFIKLSTQMLMVLALLIFVVLSLVHLSKTAEFGRLTSPTVGVKTLKELQESLVYIQLGDYEDPSHWGSGWAFRSGDEVFVWSCAHLFRHARANTNDFSKQKIYVKTKRIEGFTDNVEFITSECEVIRYDLVQDLSLLHVKDPEFPARTPVWDQSVTPPPLGAKQVTSSCPLRPEMWGCLTYGRLVFHGRPFISDYVDDTTCVGTVGSSGSGVFLEDPARGYPCIGIMIGGYNDLNIMAYVPARSVRRFADRAKVLWAFDYNVERPDLETIRTVAPIEFPPPDQP